MLNQNIRHHLPDHILLAYAAGTLPEAFSLVVACHVSNCVSCRATVEGLDAMGGGVLELAPVAPLEDDSLARTMAKINAGEGARTGAVPEPVTSDVLPQALQSYVGGGLDAIRWRRTGGGARQCILPIQDKSANARLLYIPAGTAVPDHGHRGLELTLVLQGAFADQVDRFGPGDVEVGDTDLDHKPVAEPGEDCICLAATDAPLRFHGLLPRLAQPFLRI